MFQIKQKIKYKGVHQDYRRMSQKFKKKVYHVNVNVSLMVEVVTQTKSGITRKSNMSAKKIIYMKKTVFRILLHVVAKIVKT